MGPSYFWMIHPESPWRKGMSRHGDPVASECVQTFNLGTQMKQVHAHRHKHTQMHTDTDGARCWIPRPLLHRDDDSVLAKLFWGGTRPLGYLLVPLGCDYLFLRYHYQVLSPPSMGALKWMFTSFKVSLSSAKPNQQLTQYPLVKWGLYSWTPDSQTHTWNEKCFVPSWLGTYN